MVSILLLLGALGQQPGAPSHRSIAEIRQSLNRFSDIDRIAMEARIRHLLETENSNEAITTGIFAFSKELGILPPFKQAEMDMISEITWDAIKQTKKKPPTPNQQTVPPQQRAWYNTTLGWKWGWMQDGVVIFIPNEQPR